MDNESRDVERVRVAVRVRPRNQREEALDGSARANSALDVDAAAGQIQVCKRKADRTRAIASSSSPSIQSLTGDRELRFAYDRVFAPEAPQTEIFDYVRDSVQQVAQGFNCTIFAYGQTGTGKTHTMLGRGLENGTDTRDAWGVIPRAVECLFEELQSIALRGAAAAIVHCSYMQIYNNDVFDLLQENTSRMKEPLVVREIIKGNDKQIYVSGLSEFRVTSLDETLKLLRQGNKNRTIRATEYNEKSSRSHALLQLSVEVESRGAEGPTTIIRRAKLSLVDLAGSEKWATDVVMSSERCKELTSINQSLSALGNVISALANPKRAHVPYRDSKLTRLLQDSLGGNTRTTVLATISQDESAIEETISVLLFADRAKCVTLRVKANEVVDDAVLLVQARREIARLKLQLAKHTSQIVVEELEQKLAKLSRDNSVLVSENKRLKEAVAVMKKDQGKVRPSVESLRVDTPTSDRSVFREDTRGSQPPMSTVHNGTNHLRPLGSIAELAFTEPQEQDQDGRNMWCDVDEQDQACLLKQIQSERRALEEELERIEQHTGRRSGGERTDSAGAEDLEDVCPICGHSIDGHTDEELDRCIDQEHEATQNGERKVKTPNGCQSLPPFTPPASTQPATNRSDTNTRKPASPYLQNLFSKAPAPSPPPRTSLRAPSSKLSAQRRSVRDLRKPREVNESSTAGCAEELLTIPRPLSAANSNKSGGGIKFNRPIVHHGPKTVKALKKLQVSSPYNQSHSISKRAAAPSPPCQSNNDTPSDDQVTGSLRDIGLSLLVYKFRYDCWYPCTIVGFDTKRRLHCCQYEYGDKQWQDLAQSKTQVVGRQQ